MKKVKCPNNCDHGKFYYMGNTTCPICHGHGRDMKEDLWAAPCAKCGGLGEVPRPTETCTVCSGHGFILTN
jgi:DnaJ-class molecular chaperone